MTSAFVLPFLASCSHDSPGYSFYDSDGTITTSFWKRLTLKAMSKPLIYVLGNHDIWTGGAPAAGVVYDPLQYSLQYFGIDTVVSKDNGNYFDYTINPDSPPAGSGTKYQSIGNLTLVRSFCSCFGSQLNLCFSNRGNIFDSELNWLVQVWSVWHSLLQRSLLL